jgi:sugar phosphate isomerase/epimerase
MYRNPEFIIKMHEYIPELKTCLDIKQAMQSGIDYVEYLKADGDTLKTVHVCDWDGDRLCPPGKGSFDFKEFIKRLDGAGYTGPIMIELYSRDYNSFEDVK